MRVGLYTNHRKTKSISAASFTHNQTPPASFQYVLPEDKSAKIIMATDESADWCLRESKGDTRAKVLWQQESRWRTTPWEFIPKGFDLILSNQKQNVLLGASYMTLVGTWLPPEPHCDKTDNISVISSGKQSPLVVGYHVRREVKKLLGPYYKHAYGGLYGFPLENKADCLVPYRFHIAIESEKYPWWHTEKLFDCFAARTVPLYWGCDDQEKLEELGFDTSGIVYWSTIQELSRVISTCSPAMYETMQNAVEHNYNRIRNLYCAEVQLEKVLNEALFLHPSDSVQRKRMDNRVHPVGSVPDIW